MQFPFTIVLEAPSRAELERLARARWARAISVILVAASAVGLFVLSTQPPSGPEVGGARLQVSSVPEAATVAIDGQTRGRTPIDLQITAREYRITVSDERTIEATYQVRLEAGQTRSNCGRAMAPQPADAATAPSLSRGEHRRRRLPS